MSLVQKIKSLADERRETFAEIERKVGLSNGQIRRWDKASPKSENLKLVADHFNVSTDYLLGRTDSPDLQVDNKTIAKQIMMRSSVDNLSSEDAEEIEKEVERFLNWRLEEIKRERSEKD